MIGWLLFAVLSAPSTVVFPPQQIPLRFDHRYHVEEEGLDCDLCHEAALQSARPADRLMPDESICANCHDVDEPEGCPQCHVGFPATERGKQTPARAEFPAARLHFSHRLHGQADVSCEECHRGVRTVAMATVAHLPTEAMCVQCHRDRHVSNACSTCHLGDPSGRLVTQFSLPASPPERVALRLHASTSADRLLPTGRWGVAHDKDFLTGHGPAAAANPPLCESCHRPEDCRDCHGGVARPLRIHPGDWVALHGVEASVDSQNCASCHRSQSFCLDCHRRTRMVPARVDTQFAFPADQRVHPPGWVEWSGGGEHAFVAPLEMDRCSSCHTEDSCITCHGGAGVGGAGMNPHPGGFADRCQTLLSQNSVACVRCHGQGFSCP